MRLCPVWNGREHIIISIFNKIKFNSSCIPDYPYVRYVTSQGMDVDVLVPYRDNTTKDRAYAYAQVLKKRAMGKRLDRVDFNAYKYESYPIHYAIEDFFGKSSRYKTANRTVSNNNPNSLLGGFYNLMRSTVNMFYINYWGDRFYDPGSIEPWCSFTGIVTKDINIKD